MSSCAAGPYVVPPLSKLTTRGKPKGQSINRSFFQALTTYLHLHLHVSLSNMHTSDVRYCLYHTRLSVAGGPRGPRPATASRGARTRRPGGRACGGIPRLRPPPRNPRHELLRRCSQRGSVRAIAPRPRRRQRTTPKRPPASRRLSGGGRRGGRQTGGERSSS